MASRCGCAGTCACVLATDGTISLSGNGSAASPWLMGVVPNCTATMDCVGSNITNPVTYTGGRLGVKVSADANQAVILGSDGGLFVQAGSAAGVSIADTATIDMSGTGASATPLKADWLGATTVNTNNSGVQLNGTGTPANPLNATWTGVTTSVTNPEMVVTGKGTPTNPMAFAWGGLPWTKVAMASIPTIATGVSNYYVTWSAVGGHGSAVVIPNSSNTTQLTCQRSGAYILLAHMRFALTAANAVAGGYIQLYFENASGPTPVTDAVINTPNSGWCDLCYSEQVQLTVGQNYQARVLNASGSAATGGFLYCTFFRISD